MRGDQLSRQWQTIRAIESSNNRLTVAEIAKREETGIRTIYRDLEALQVAGFPLYPERAAWSNRWAFINDLKFKISPRLHLNQTDIHLPLRVFKKPFSARSSPFSRRSRRSPREHFCNLPRYNRFTWGSNITVAHASS